MDPFGRILKVGGMVIGIAILFGIFADLSRVIAQLIRENIRDMLLVGAFVAAVIWLVKQVFGDKGGHGES